MRKGLLVEGFLIGLLSYLLVFQILAIWPFTIDDMYITLRYAKHLASGFGIVWNVHEPPVEGYSNFSFLLISTVSLLLKKDPVFVSKIVGWIGLIFSLLFIFLISRLWFERRDAWLPCIGILLYKGQIIWAVAGLETTLFEALVDGAVYFIFRGLGFQFYPRAQGAPNLNALFTAGLLLSFAGLTRPETPALMALFFILIAMEPFYRRKIWSASPLVWFCLPILIIYIPYFLWRWNYFGLLFPNPIYCKGFAKELPGFLDKKYLQLIWPFILCSIPACIKSQDIRPYFLLAPSFLYLILLYYADPIVAFDNRLFLAAFILLYPLVQKGLREFFLTSNFYFYLSLLLFAFLFIPSMSLSQYRFFTEGPQEGEQLRQSLILWLSEHTKAGDFVVLGDSGLIPYKSHLNFIDSYCLNNKQMAQWPEKQRYELFCQQVLSQNPKLFILTSLIQQGKTRYTPSDRCLRQLLEHHDAYQLIKIFKTGDNTSTYSYELFIKNAQN